MDIKKAEDIIDKMYQDKMSIREKQTKEGVELDLSKNVTFTELEEASIILLRNYLILKRKNEEKDKQMDLMAETIRKLSIGLANYKGSYDKETINFTGNIKKINQYFEKLAKEKGK